MPKPTNLIKIGEAAKLLGVHPMTLRRWEKDGKIEPAVRTGGTGTRYYDRNSLVLKEVDQYLTEDEVRELVGMDLEAIGWGTGPAYYKRETVEANLAAIAEYKEAVNG